MATTMQNGYAKVTKPHRKGYHRRAPRACDECRLRKIRCDGAQPCGPCGVSKDACSYDPGTRPRETPTQRIRKLETCLRNVRISLERLKERNQTVPNNDIDNVLENMEASYPEPDGGDVPADDDETRNLSLNSMMGNVGRVIVHSISQTSYYGPYSGYAFVLKTLELFRPMPDNPTLAAETQTITSTLLNAPMPDAEAAYSTQFQSLPSLSITLGLLEVVFKRCHPIIQFVHEDDFRDMVRRLYSESALQFGASSHDFMPLFHSVLAIALLFDLKSRRKHGCEDIVIEATRHFLLARRELDIAQCADLISMQTLLCLITFLMTTSRLTSAYTYLGIACTSALRLGLHKEVPKEHAMTETQEEARLRVMLAVLQLDMTVSVVLDMPARINPECLDSSIMTALQLPGIKKPPHVHDTLSEAQVKFAASARHLHIASLTASGLQGIFQNDRIVKDRHEGVDMKKLINTEDSFRKWAKALSSLPIVASKPEMSAITKYELEMSFYLGQFILYQPFLHYLTLMASGHPITRTQSQHALACIKIAATTITRSEIMHQRSLLAPASWCVIYTLFQAVMCLLFLIATHNGTSRPSEAWKKGELGIRLLATMRCYDNGAVRCLWIIKMVIKQLSHTVSFDVDQIVALTDCSCPCGRSSLLPTEALDRRPSSREQSDLQTGSGGASAYATPETPIDVRSAAPSLLNRPGNEHLLMSSGFGNVDSPKHDADYILAEAENIALALPIDSMDLFGMGSMV